MVVETEIGMQEDKLGARLTASSRWAHAAALPRAQSCRVLCRRPHAVALTMSANAASLAAAQAMDLREPPRLALWQLLVSRLPAETHIYPGHEYTEMLIQMWMG